MVAEVSSSTVSIDLGKKRDVYQRNGVREYIVWRVLDQQIDWFANRNGQFEPMLPAADGVLQSTVFPGLWLDRDALLHGDFAAVSARLQQGLASESHAQFVARLERASTT